MKRKLTLNLITRHFPRPWKGKVNTWPSRPTTVWSLPRFWGWQSDWWRYQDKKKWGCLSRPWREQTDSDRVSSWGRLGPKALRVTEWLMIPRATIGWCLPRPWRQQFNEWEITKAKYKRPKTSALPRPRINRWVVKGENEKQGLCPSVRFRLKKFLLRGVSQQWQQQHSSHG